MRAPLSLFGSINPRAFAPVLVVSILTAFSNVQAQAPVPGLGGGFEVDGNLYSNNPGGIIGLGDDWLTGPGGPGTGVLNSDGTPKNPMTTLHVRDLIGNADLDVFDGSNKVFANPNTYKWKAGSAPQKDDIQNGLVYFTDDGTGNHWMRLAGDRRSINGESYIDYEFLQATLTKNANGTFTSQGPDGGRTVGDILLTIHLTQGGAQAEFFAQRWQAVGAGFDYVPIAFPAGEAFVGANVDSTITSTYDVFGSHTYGENQFGEAAVNLDALLPNFSRCFGIATVFVRTKSSTSNDAVLKDFIEPVQVNMCLDDTPPVLTPPVDVSLLCNQSTDPQSAGIADASDDCDTDVEVTFHDTILPGGCAQNYTIQRVWTAVDNCGNSDEATQLISVVDNTAPVIVSSPGPVTVECVGDIPLPNPNSVTTSGECGKVTVTHLSDVSNGQSCPAVITRTYRVSDECGNARNVTQTITVDDNTPPNVGALSPINLQCRADVPAANIGIVVASDNCGTPVVTHLSDVSNGQSCPEVITRTYRVTDACGNRTDRVQVITIHDTTNPIVGALQAIAVQCKGDVPVPNIALVTASDNCSTPVVTHLSDVSNGQTCPEVITRTYRATDACGNKTDRVQLITIDDTTLPDIMGPNDLVVSCVSGVPAVNLTLIIATDNCGKPTVAHVSDISDGKSCPQVIVRTYRATDACGNSRDWTQRIIVDDTTPPSVSPLNGIVVSCAGQVPAPNTGIVQAGDNCGGVLVTHLGDQSDGKTCGTRITRTYRVTDACGNRTDVTQVITVDDRTAPVITQSPGPVAVTCSGDIPVADVNSVRATDNCGTATITFLGDTSDGKTCPTTITRRYRAADTCGNATTVTQIITVDDDVPPVLSACAADQSLECPTQIVFTRPTATDNCDPAPKVQIVDSDSTLGPEAWTYRLTRTFQAFDQCGNASAQCSQTIKAHCEQDHLCSFTQGNYGTYGGYFNKMSTIQLIRSLLANEPLVVGKPGRSLKFNLNAADCIVARLPAGTTPKTLPAIGNATVNHNTCQTPTPIPVDANGKYENVLLGQTITLTLNTRLSPWMPLFPLTHKFCTQDALPGPDGLLGTADDVLDASDTPKTYTIPTGVLTALDNLGLPRLVAGLLELSNRALAGHATGGATLSQINDAATAINEGFDGCRFIVACDPKVIATGDGIKLDNTSGASMTLSSAPTKFEVSQNAPNPFNPVTTIRFALPQASNWNVSVFDVAGRLVKTFEGHEGGASYVNLQWDGTDQRGAPVASGIYLYRVRAGHYADVKKMVLLK